MTSLIVSFIEFLISLCSNLLPDFNFESTTYNAVSDGFLAIANFVTDVNFIVPLADIMLIIGLKISISIFKVGLFAANWVIRRIADIIP